MCVGGCSGPEAIAGEGGCDLCTTIVLDREVSTRDIVSLFTTKTMQVFNRLVATVGACFPCRLQYAQPINIHIIVSQFRLQMAMDN